MEKSLIYQRISQRLKELGVSERQASLEAVGNSQFIRNIRKGASLSPRADNVVKLAKALKVTPAWLMGIDEDEGPIGATLQKGVRYGGIVEAGTFRRTDNINQDDEFRLIEMPLDPRYEASRQFAFEVVGDSMTKAHIEEGMWVLAVDSHHWQRLHGELRDGLLVIVAKLRNGDPERELTVKRLRVFRDRIELCPESANPKHQALIYPHGDEDPSHGIIAVVLQAIWKFN